MEIVHYIAQVIVLVCHSIKSYRGSSSEPTVIDEVVVSLIFPDQNDSARLTSNATSVARPDTEMREMTSGMATNNPASVGGSGDPTNISSSTNQKESKNKKAPLSAEQI